MKFLIVPCSQDLDTMLSMYLYYQFILKTDFEVSCYIDKQVNSSVFNLLKENNIIFNISDRIKDEDKLIILNKGKFSLNNEINKDKVTEIISLKQINDIEFIDANIKIDKEVKLLTTIIVERYREYELNFPKEIILLLIKIYDENNIKLKQRDIIAKEYIKLLYVD